MTDHAEHAAQSGTTMSRGLGITAIVLSVVAIGISGFVYLQLPEEVSLTDLETQVSTLETRVSDQTQAIEEIANDQSMATLTADLQEAFGEVGSRLNAVEREASEAVDRAEDAVNLADEAYTRTEEIEQNLGVCLYAQEFGFRYTYWSRVTFGGLEYIYRCEY